MPATTPNVGVRTFLNRTDVVPFLIADMSTIGGVFTPGTGLDRALFPVDTPVHFTTSDTAMVAGAGTGTLRQTIDAIVAMGITASIVAVVPDILPADTDDQQMAKMTGSPSAKTGCWALLSALDFLSELALLPEPAILPGYEVKWERDLNSNATMRVGGLVFAANWEESPALVDLQIYTGRREASFNILADEIQAAMAQHNVSGSLGQQAVGSSRLTRISHPLPDLVPER